MANAHPHVHVYGSNVVTGRQAFVMVTGCAAVDSAKNESADTAGTMIDFIMVDFPLFEA